MPISVIRNREQMPQGVVTEPFTASVNSARIPNDGAKFCSSGINEFQPSGVLIENTIFVEHSPSDVVHYIEGLMYK